MILSDKSYLYKCVLGVVFAVVVVVVVGGGRVKILGHFRKKKKNLPAQVSEW